MSGPFLRIIFGLRGCSLGKARWSILMWTLILVISCERGATGESARRLFLTFKTKRSAETPRMFFPGQAKSISAKEQTAPISRRRQAIALSPTVWRAELRAQSDLSFA